MQAMIPILRTRFLAMKRTKSFSTEFPASHQTVVVQRLGIRSGITGFLAGVSLAGMAAFAYLVDDLKGSSHTLLVGVDEVGEKVKKMDRHISQINELKTRIDGIPAEYTSKRDLDQVRRDLLKAIDTVHLETLDLKMKLWELENKNS